MTWWCCRNPSLGLITKVRACKVGGQERKPKSKKKCEGMNPHIPKGASTLEVRVLVDSRMFKEQLQGPKLNGLKSYLYHWKVIETQMFKMGSHDPFGHLKHKLWPKEGSGVKLAIWLLTIKSQKSTWFRCIQVVWNILLESSRRRLQLCFRPHFNRNSTHKAMGPQSCGSSNFGNLDVGLVERHIIYYKGKVVAFSKFELWWVLWTRISPWFVLAPKVLQLCTNQLVIWFCVGPYEWVSACQYS